MKHLTPLRESRSNSKVRPRLVPEQEVSLSVFQLAEGDYKLRKATLESEENALERSVEVAIGKEFHTVKNHFFLRLRRAGLTYRSGSGEFRGSDFKVAVSGIERMLKGNGDCKGASWPDLKLGPSLPIPITGVESISHLWCESYSSIAFISRLKKWRRTAVAAAGLMRAEQSLELRKRELGQQRKMLFNQYQKSSKALKESVLFLTLKRKHKSVERQF